MVQNCSRLSPGRLFRAGIGVVTLGLASVTLVACSSSSPSLYSLQPVAARVPAVNSSFLPLSVPTLVEVRNPTIPQTLDRDRIVLGDGGFKLDVSPSDSWSEPLSSQIPHVLTSDLRQRLPGTSFFAQDDATATTPQAYVELVVNRFSRDAAGNAVLEAQVSVHRADADAVKTNRSLHLSQPAPAGTEGLVSALSALLGQVADQVSQDLKSLPPEPTEAK